MFSGIIQRLGTVKKIEQLGEGKRFYIDIGKQEKLRNSYSICISGCCLTVVKIKKERTDAKRQSFIASFDVMPETLRKTYFSSLKQGDKVNVERSLHLGDEIGGHFVSGHVDCVGKIIRCKDFSDFCEMTIEFPKEFSHLLIDKGSVAVDGISLTVVKVNKNNFSIALIPETLKLTTLGFKKEFDIVNIEFDQMAKYVSKLLGK